MKNKKKILSIFYLLLLIPFFKTDYMNKFISISTFFNYWKIFSLCVIGFMFIKNKKMNKNFIILMCFCIWPLIITFTKDGNFISAFSFYGILLAFGFLFQVKGKDLQFINILLICFEIVIYINFFTMIVFPQGLYSTGSNLVGIARENWFLGFKNVMVTYFLPGYVISDIYSNLTGKKIRTYILSIIILISAILSSSATSIVGIIMMIIVSKLSFFRKKINIFNIKTYTYISFILFILIVIFRFQNVFSFFIVDILHKDLTLTNRTILWDVTINKILQSPIIGYGWQYIDIRHLMYNSKTIITAHNQILEFIYVGGTILFALYIILIFISANDIKNDYNDKNIQIISLGFFILQILNLTEVYLNPIMYFILIFLVFAKKFKMEVNENVKNINNNSSI